MKEMDWRIYNEWGNEIFHSADQNDGGWTERIRKTSACNPLCLYIEGTTVSGDVIDMHGETTIMR